MIRQQESIDSIRNTLNRQFGECTIQRCCDLPTVSAMSTGLPEIDSALGIGGIPVGRIVEIFGPPSAGKTALALQIAKQTNASLFIDADRTLVKSSLPGCEDIHIVTVDTLKDALQIVEIAAPAFDVIVLDTLTALPTAEEMTMRLGESASLSTAKLLSIALPRLAGLLAKHKCTFIIVNQTRTNPAVLFGNPEKVPGGNALRHYTSVSLSVRCTGYITQAGKRTGQIIRASVIKSKCAPQYQTATMALDFIKGFQPCTREITA